jgi:hypothetical protein
MGFEIRVEGADQLKTALADWRKRTEDATQDALKASSTVVQDQIQGNLIRRFYPPSSPPGEPPASRTGYLFDRVLKRFDGQISAGVYKARVFPSTVYARIQELGGVTGRGHRTRLPPRPYVQPAVDAVRDRVRQLFIDAWTRATGG